MHCILYTDGGCKTVEGKPYGGYGFHGYFYTPTVATKGYGQPKGIPTRLGWQRKNEADASQTVTLLRYLEGYGTEATLGTNNAAELLGAIEGLQYVKAIHDTDEVGRLWAEDQAQKKTKSKTDVEPPNTTLESVTLYTDSEYVVKGINGAVHTWIKNGWKTSAGTPVKNQAHWKALLSAVEALEGIPLTIKWVKGHNGDVGNERADLMANLGMNHALFDEYVKTHALHVPEGHWKTAYEHNRMLGTQTWYYNTKQKGPVKVDWDRPYYLYHLGRNDADDDDQHGKRINNDTYSVVALHEPDDALEMVRKAQCKLVDPDIDYIALGRLNHLFNSSVYDRVRRYGMTALRANRVTGNIYELGKSEISRALKVPMIAYRAIDALNHLEGLLQRVVTHTTDPDEHTTDITEHVYDEHPKKGHTLVKTITVASPSMDIDLTHACGGTATVQSTRLVVGMDLPPRNVLLKLAGENPTVTAITWPEGPTSYRVATIITTNQGHALWVGHYANIVRAR